MPGLQTYLSAYLCTFRVCAKDKNLGRNFKRIRRTDKLKGWQTYWQQFRFVKIFENDTLPSYARATDISVCLPTHIQSFCQRQKSWKKLQEDQMNRQTERLTNILSTISACQDFCKWHFTQLCQGYRHFCLLTYAHSEFVPKTKSWRKVVRSRRSDEQTDWQAKDKILEKKL